MKKYGDLLSEFLSAEKGSEKYVSLFYQLRDMDSAVPVRTSPHGNYYTPKSANHLILLLKIQFSSSFVKLYAIKEYPPVIGSVYHRSHFKS
jgi:hypothetical protein